MITSRLVYKTRRRGEHFFHRNEPAGRMFFIEHGTVSLIDPQAGHRAPETIHETASETSIRIEAIPQVKTTPPDQPE